MALIDRLKLKDKVIRVIYWEDGSLSSWQAIVTKIDPIKRTIEIGVNPDIYRTMRYSAEGNSLLENGVNDYIIQA